jgi:hypothetical protein
MSDGNESEDVSVKRITLLAILEAFNAPIKFDQAWAIIYIHLSLVEENALFPLISSFSEVFLNSEGIVSLVSPQESTSEAEFLSGLGEVVFNALDYGNGDDDDLELPDELENLLSYMIGTVDEDTTDDGFCENKITIRNVLKICKKHSGSEHKEHYKKVVKALYSEAYELRDFLSKINSANQQLKKIRSKHDDDEDIYSELDKNQWSSAWLGVMRTLRSGVTLNRVEHHHKVPFQFELSPYEMLMDDIRKKKYSLKEAPEFPEYLRKDSHDIILDFIRSRPPLNPASKRKLKAKPKVTTTHEQLMDEIKSGSILKSVPEEMRPCPEIKSLETAKETMRGVNRQPKKVIRVSQIEFVESESEDEDFERMMSQTVTSSESMDYESYKGDSPLKTGRQSAGVIPAAPSPNGSSLARSFYWNHLIN